MRAVHAVHAVSAGLWLAGVGLLMWLLSLNQPNLPTIVTNYWAEHHREVYISDGNETFRCFCWGPGGPELLRNSCRLAGDLSIRCGTPELKTYLDELSR